MQLEDRHQRLKLQKALLGAFPGKSQLETLLDYGLDERLNTIVRKFDGTLRDHISDVLDWAHEKDRVAELLIKARMPDIGNPSHKNLEKVINEIWLANIPQSLPEPPLTDTWRNSPLSCCQVGSGVLLRQISQEDQKYIDIIGLWYWADELRLRLRNDHTRQTHEEVDVITEQLIEVCQSLGLNWLEFLASIRNPARKFPEEQLNCTPHPIATCFQIFNVAETEKDRFEALDLLLNNTIKYLTAIALSQYWQDRPDKAQLRSWLGSLSQAQLHTSLTLVDQIYDHYLSVSDKSTLFTVLFKPYTSRVDDQSAIVKAYRFINDAPDRQREPALITPRAFLGRLLEYRQTAWETKPGQIEVGLRKQLLPLLRDALDYLLEMFQPLLSYALYSVEDLYQDGTDWVARLVAFPGASGEIRLVDGFYRETNVAESALRRYRLYLCSPDRKYWLQLHPFLRTFEYNKLYFLEQKAQSGDIWYSCCTPPARITLSEKALTLLRESLIEDTEIDVVEQFEQVNAELEHEENTSRALTMPIDILLNVYLSQDARQAVAIALGEALRIGHFWLGVEFLLMGLSKQPESVFVRLLQKIRLDPGELRGALRGLIGVVNNHWRRIEDVETLGTKALAELREADLLTLAGSFDPVGPHQPVITPRMVSILRDAAQIAFEGTQEKHHSNPRVEHVHLLLTALKHQQCRAIIFFLGIVVNAGLMPNEMFIWLQRESGSNNPVAPEAVPDSPKLPPIRQAPADRVGPRLVQGLLTRLSVIGLYCTIDRRQ